VAVTAVGTVREPLRRCAHSPKVEHGAIEQPCSGTLSGTRPFSETGVDESRRAVASDSDVEDLPNPESVGSSDNSHDAH
jgi:hypothetical protein